MSPNPGDLKDVTTVGTGPLGVEVGKIRRTSLETMGGGGGHLRTW